MAAEGAGTVGKALSLLSLLGEHPDGATAREVAEASGHHFSTAYRLLRGLVDTGFVAYTPEDKRYRLGLPVFQLGQKVAHRRGFDGSALPVLQRLAEATGESCLLAVLDGDRFLTVLKVDGPEFRITTDPGDHGPLHSAALGHVLLAFSDDAAREHLLAEIELTPRTGATLTDRQVLRARIDEVRERGFSSQSQEHDDGMVAAAVPVRTEASGLIAALGLAAPLFRTDALGLEAHLPRLRSAAVELAAILPPRPR